MQFVARPCSCTLVGGRASYSSGAPLANSHAPQPKMLAVLECTGQGALVASAIACCGLEAAVSQNNLCQFIDI